MIAFRLAYRNLAGAGLRTWLNAAVLSISFVVIVWHKGLLEGWNRQARRDTIDWEIGGGQYWHASYDPYDPFTLADSHGPLPAALRAQQAAGGLAPILIGQATIYPEGRMRSVLLKGIDPAQRVLRLPSAELAVDTEEIPILLGTRMARANHLRVGDVVAARWRDAGGTFDAADARVVGIFKTNVPTVDDGTVWVPLSRLRAMLRMPGESTLLVAAPAAAPVAATEGWRWQGHAELLGDFDRMMRQKSVGGFVLYGLLLFLALLALFDTQVLSVFRRQREIGTHIALGMTRGQVIRLFTLEGTLHAVLGVLLAFVWGGPLLWLQATQGFDFPAATDDYGFAVADTVFPAYTLGWVLTTVVLVLLATTIVSFMPARRIARMRPTDAIRGKIQ